MGHFCPDCGMSCHCHGDIDDIIFDRLPTGGCDCCAFRDDDDGCDDDGWDSDEGDGGDQ